MEPTRVDSDVQAIIAFTMRAIEALQEKIEKEGNGLLRILARIYGVPVEESDFLALANLKDGGLHVFDTRLHVLGEGGFVALPNPVDPPPYEPSIDETYELAGQAKLTDTHTDPETGNPLIVRA